jgi:hypothetical protein
VLQILLCPFCLKKKILVIFFYSNYLKGLKQLAFDIFYKQLTFDIMKKGWIRGICRDKCFFPDPRPEVPAGEFFPPSPSPRNKKIFVLGAPSGTIPAVIPSD